MLLKRIIVSLILVPSLGLAIYLGGWVYTLTVVLILSLAGWEYGRMVGKGGFTPSIALLIVGIAGMVLLTALLGFTGLEIVFSLMILILMGVSVTDYERGGDQPASHFAITTLGFVYLGWMGSHFIQLRNLPDGLWWTVISLPAAWVADVGAFFVGTQVGKHRLAPRVSPRKSWEGYFGGLPAALAWGCAAAWFIQAAAPDITPLKGAILCLIIGITAPLGDLFESLLKRQFGVKDTSNILPGHGGVMDRIDTSLWTAVISYYLIVYLLK